MSVDLINSKAYKNSFFERAKQSNGKADCALFITEWYPVTEAFCLGLMHYNALFASEILRSAGKRRDALERAILVPLQIGAEEFGSGMHGVDGIHYRMFARLGKPLGLTVEHLRQKVGVLPETHRLVKGIRSAFNDMYLGAGCIRVVEGTAYNIVEAMDYIFKSMKQLDGAPLFTQEQMEYVSLHLVIEKEHDCMASEFIEGLCDTSEEEERVETGVQRMGKLFGDYWEAMATAVYGCDSVEAVSCARC